MFSLSRVVEAPPARVFRAFTEPEPFSHWFVATGFITPADRVDIDARPDGLIAAVFVSEDDGTEVAFTLRFGEIDPPHTVVIHLDDPAEVVTVKLHDLGDDRTRLDYHSSGLPADQQTTIEPGVAHMLDLLAAYFAPTQQTH